MKFTLTDFFDSQHIVNKGFFDVTLYPGSNITGSLCYCRTKDGVDKIINNKNITCVITTKELAQMFDKKKDIGVALSSIPELDYYRIHNILFDKGITSPHQRHYISEKAQIHHSVFIGNNVVIEDDVIIEPLACIGNNTIIQKGTYIGHGVIIGNKGMQNLKVNGKRFDIKFAGGVKIGSDCEVLAYAMIQRPYQAFYTEIGDDTQLSAKVSVGHGSKIGNKVMIAGNTTIAGNVQVGNEVWIGPSVTISDGIFVGESAKLLIGSVIVSNVPERKTVSGNFALEHHKTLKNIARIKKI